MARPHWKDIAAAHIAQRDALFPPEWLIPSASLPPAATTNILPLIPPHLTPREDLITTTPAHEIVAHTTAGTWTAEEVTRAFCHRATLAHQLTNCLTEVLFDAALARARALDAHLAAIGRPAGPLHGLPVSLKDQFNIAGVPCSMGYVGFTGRVATKHSVLAETLLAAGAVLYARTNVSQGLMLFNAANNLFGETLHPANRLLTPGGSSGGEAALLLARGSPLGVGTDIGGSIRDPASWCGLYALRPSHGRVPYEGAENSMVGQEAIRSSAGPLAHSVADVALFLRAVLAQEPWRRDPQVIPLPWRDVPLQPTYNFGIVLDVDDGEGRTALHPPVRRALARVVRALRAAGHAVVPVTGHGFGEAHALAERMYGADGGREVARALAASGEPALPAVAGLLGEPAAELSALGVWDLCAERDAFCGRFAEWWDAAGERVFSGDGGGGVMDGLLCVGLPSTALPRDAPEASPWESSSFVVQLVGYAAGVVPVLQCDRDVDGRGALAEERDEELGLDWEEGEGKSENQNAWMNVFDADKMHGGWCGVQVVGRRLEEEKVVNMMQRVDEALRAEEGRGGA